MHPHEGAGARRHPGADVSFLDHIDGCSELARCIARLHPTTPAPTTKTLILLPEDAISFSPQARKVTYHLQNFARQFV